MFTATNLHGKTITYHKVNIIEADGHRDSMVIGYIDTEPYLLFKGELRHCRTIVYKARKRYNDNRNR